MIYSIIVTYNGIKWIKKCIESLLDSSVHVKVVVVDNGSTDGTLEFLEGQTELHLIKSDSNLGFSAANNLGIKYALDNEADFVFLLNQDAWVTTDTLERLQSISKSSSDYGVISPVHLSGSGQSIDYKFSTYVTPKNCPNFYSDIYISTLSHINNPLKNIYPVNFINAAAWFIPKDCLKIVGFFEELFFLYGEDINYADRVKFHKLKIGVTPSCIIYHDRPQNATYKKNIWLPNHIRNNTLRFLLSMKNDYWRTFVSLNLLYCKKLLVSGWYSFSLAKLVINELLYMYTHMFSILKAKKKY